MEGKSLESKGKSTKLFGIDSDDSDYLAEDGEFDDSTATELQTLKTTKAALMKEQEKHINQRLPHQGERRHVHRRREGRNNPKTCDANR